ncbi:hypothetical protein ACTJK9_22655 [Pseudomonas sp. 22082]|uniref:hypothetical protein n=1 Tax=Pseudomonas sp. 22082 TaxID=3453868 RepID=UPI003F825421
MPIEADFVRDWTAELQRIMEQDWAMDLSQVPAHDLAALFFHAMKRRIEPRPRTVKLSASFSCPPAHASGWASLKEKIEDGQDLSPHLSLLIEKVMAKDPLLLDWGVYHLHLGEAVHPKNWSFVERTGPVLFGFPTENAFHAIGIYEHGAWSDSSVIETLNTNWPELTAKAKVQGVVPLTRSYTDEDRAKLRAAGLNLVTPLSDGTFLMALGGGYSTNGISTEGVRAADQEESKIRGIQDQIHAMTAEIERTLKTEGYDGAQAVVARLNFALGKCWISFDGYKLILDIE